MLVGMKFRLKLKVLKKLKSRTHYDFQKGDEFRLKLANKYQLLAELGDTERTQDPANQTQRNCGTILRCRYSNLPRRR